MMRATFVAALLIAAGCKRVDLDIDVALRTAAMLLDEDATCVAGDDEYLCRGDETRRLVRCDVGDVGRDRRPCFVDTAGSVLSARLLETQMTAAAPIDAGAVLAEAP